MTTDLRLVILVVALLLAASIILYQFITGVPPMSSNAKEVASIIALLRQADLPENATIYDLGSGWGSLVLSLALAFPRARIRGIELSPLPYWFARFRTKHLNNIHLTRGNFFRAELRDADAVTCFLMPKPMPRVAQFFDRTLKPGTPVVTLAFWFRERKAHATNDTAGPLSQAALYLWPAKF